MVMGTRTRIAALFLAATSLAACGGKPEQASSGTVRADGPRLAVRHADTVEWRDVSAEVTTVDQAQALARIPGVLTTLTVREGDTVRRGQVIGRIVDSQLGYQAGAYGAQAAAAEAQAAQARAELARTRFLFENGVYARARLEQAQAAASAADAQTRAARAQQSAVGAVEGQGVVVAPASGRVLRADVPAGSPVAPGMSIATITAGPTVVRLHMPESLADKVHAGSRVRLSLPGSGNATGTVTRVYPAVEAGQVTADVAVAGIEDRFIGRRVSAQVETGTRRALLVPRQFVRTSYGIDTVTVVGRDGTAAQVPVQTAPSSEEGKVEILSGLNDGDTIVGAAQ